MLDNRCAAKVAALIAFCGLLIAPAQAETSNDSAVIIDTDRSIVLAGGSVNPSKPVPGNMVAAGGRVVVDQPIGNNAVLAGGVIDVRAPVAGNVRSAGGSITISGNVGGNLAAAGGEVRIAREATVTGAARVFSGTLTIDGRIDGPLRASAERIIINGEVQGDIKAAAEQIVLGPGAKIGGSLDYVSGEELVKGEGATIGGAVTRKAPPEAGGDAEETLPRIGRGARIFGTIVSYVALLGCGALFLAIAPIFSVEAPDRIRSSPGRSLGTGLLMVIGLPILAVLFMLTIIGIPVGGMLVALYPFLLLFGFMVGALFLANLATSLLKRPPPPTVAKAVGHYAVALAAVLLLTRVPAVGGFLLAVLIVLGIGAFSIELYRRTRTHRRPPRTAATAG